MSEELSQTFSNLSIETIYKKSIKKMEKSKHVFRKGKSCSSSGTSQKITDFDDFIIINENVTEVEQNIIEFKEEEKITEKGNKRWRYYDYPSEGEEEKPDLSSIQICPEVPPHLCTIECANGGHVDAMICYQSIHPEFYNDQTIGFDYFANKFDCIDYDIALPQDIEPGDEPPILGENNVLALDYIGKDGMVNKELLTRGFTEWCERNYLIIGDNMKETVEELDKLNQILSERINHDGKNKHSSRGFLVTVEDWQGYEEMILFQNDLLELTKNLPVKTKQFVMPKDYPYRSEKFKEYVQCNSFFLRSLFLEKLKRTRIKEEWPYNFPCFAILAVMQHLYDKVEWLSCCEEFGGVAGKRHIHFVFILPEPAKVNNVRLLLKEAKEVRPLIKSMFTELDNINVKPAKDANILNYLSKENEIQCFFSTDDMMEEYYPLFVERYKAHLVQKCKQGKQGVGDGNSVACQINNLAGQFIVFAVKAMKEDGKLSLAAESWILDEGWEFLKVFILNEPRFSGRMAPSLLQWGKSLPEIYFSKAQDQIKKGRKKIKEIMIKSNFAVLNLWLAYFCNWFNNRNRNTGDPNCNNTRGINIWLYGPASVGKSSLIKILSKMDIKCYYMPRTEKYHTLSALDDGIVFRVLDEVDQHFEGESRPNVVAGKLKIWAENVIHPISLKGKEQVTIKKFFPMFATSNNSPNYTFKLDGSNGGCTAADKKSIFKTFKGWTGKDAKNKEQSMKEHYKQAMDEFSQIRTFASRYFIIILTYLKGSVLLNVRECTMNN
jgi:hypothetical protein